MRGILIIIFILFHLIANGQVDQKNPYPILPVYLDSLNNEYYNYPCKDSSFIYLSWWGDVNKPYEGLVFYKEQSCYPNPRRFFFTQFEVSEKQFSSLNTIINNHSKPAVYNHDGDMYYSFGFYNKDTIMNVMTVLEEKELIELGKKTLIIFEGTSQYYLILKGWERVLNRFNLSMPINIKQ
jgi:hypothetical protein